MKYKIIHCVDDAKMGGVSLALQALCQSALSEQFDFEIKHIDLMRLNRIPEDADILCFHGASNWRKLIGLLWLKLQAPKVSFVIQEHHYSEHFVAHAISSTPRFYRMLKWTYALMDKVVCISNSQVSWMQANQLVAPQKLVNVGQGRALTTFIPADSTAPQSASVHSHQNNCKANEDSIVIGAYGRFHQQKGFDLLLQAMANINPSRCHLLLVGEGEQQEDLAWLAASLPHVTVMKAMNDVPQFLSQCDAVIIPSRWEPFGLVFAESASMAKWLISSNIDGLGDQLKHHQASNTQIPVTVIEHLTVDGITAAIEQFLLNYDPSHQVNHLALSLWREEQWQSVQQKWQKVFATLLS